MIKLVSKFISFSQKRTLNVWNQWNTHPLFAESDAKYRAITLSKMRKLLMLVMLATFLSVGSWITLTFFGESVKGVLVKETNETIFVEVPRLPFKAFYPWNAMGGMFYYISFGFQVK